MIGGGQPGRRVGGQIDGAGALRNLWSPTGPPVRLPAGPPVCLRCNFPVPPRAMGCKNPCPNCGTIYSLGDCSD